MRGRYWQSKTGSVSLSRPNGREYSMSTFLSTLWQDESGQDMAEYALLLVLIAVVVTVAVIAFRDAITNAFNNATEQLGGDPPSG